MRVVSFKPNAAKALIASLVILLGGATFAAVETLQNDDGVCDEAIGCSNADGTSGNPNDLVECFNSASFTPPFNLIEATYSIDESTVEPPESLDLVVYEWSGAGAPGAVIDTISLGAADREFGPHAVAVNVEINTQNFCVGLSSTPEDDSFRLVKSQNDVVPGTTFIRAPTCGASDWTELNDIGFPGNWCVTATIEGEGDAECGNGVVEAGEDCDDAGESAECNDDCTFAVCGDAKLNVSAGEECDAGGESADCDTDCTFAVCGDGTTNMTAGEECDDAGESATCDPDCTFAVCGDGYVNVTAGESCELPGDPAGGNGNNCRADCTVCGDAIVDPGEECDDGNGDDTDACKNDCTEGDLLVVLKSFTATVTDDGVQIEWETALEIDNVGFRLLRATPDVVTGGREKRGEEIALHEGFLPAKGTEVTGAAYTFLDNAELEPGDYIYWLEDVDLRGVITRHGPAEVVIENDGDRVAPEGRTAPSRQR